jgi:hypothetical protein
VRASRHEPRVLSGDWSALIASGRGGTPRVEEGPDGFSGDISGTADRLAVTARSGARTGPHGDSIEPALFEIRHLITACEQIAGWIRFAGIKAALALTVDGIFASFLVPAISHLTQGTPDAAALAASALFVAGASFVALSCREAFRCILPKALNAVHTAVGRCAHVHPAAIATRCPLDRHEQFARDLGRRAAEGFRNQVLIGMMVQAHISKSKYRHVIASIKLLTAAAPPGSAYVAALGIAT